MKYADFSGLSAKDLSKKVSQLETTMFEARMKNSLGQLANPMEIRNARRDVARLKTAVTAKAAKAPVRKVTREVRLAAKLKAANAAVKG
jgi:large subunit ribosomal protein L29